MEEFLSIPSFWNLARVYLITVAGTECTSTAEYVLNCARDILPLFIWFGGLRNLNICFNDLDNIS